MAKKKSKTTLKKKEEEFIYRGYTMAKLKKMKLDELVKLLCAKQRRKIKRTLRPEEEKLLEAVSSGKKDDIRTHLRDAIVLPSMIGKKIGIHNGKGFEYVEIKPEMIGHYLGELALTRKRVSHGAAGVGATKSSKYVPLK
nr:30S ribosomal protein S19P [uncultured archaeon]